MKFRRPKGRTAKRINLLAAIIGFSSWPLAIFTGNLIFFFSTVIAFFVAVATRQSSRKPKGLPSDHPLAARPNEIWGNSGYRSAEYWLEFEKMKENERRKKKGLPPTFE